MGKTPSKYVPYRKTKNGEVRIFSDMIHLRFFGLPPSENHALRQKGYKKYPSKELKDWQKIVADVMDTDIVLSFNPDHNIWLHAELRIYTPIYNKTDNRIKRFDVHNRIKYMLDGVCEHIVFANKEPLDDRYIKRVVATKIHIEHPDLGVSKMPYTRCELILTAFGGRTEFLYHQPFCPEYRIMPKGHVEYTPHMVSLDYFNEEDLWVFREVGLRGKYTTSRKFMPVWNPPGLQCKAVKYYPTGALKKIQRERKISV